MPGCAGQGSTGGGQDSEEELLEELEYVGSASDGQGSGAQDAEEELLEELE
jgi:hypothetical protein